MGMFDWKSEGESKIIELLKISGALMEGHFILTSGLHSPVYIEKFRLLERPDYTEILCREIADFYKNENISVIVGPMTGGIILAYETGRQLGSKAIFTERVEGVMNFRRGFNLSSTDRILIIEDIITTGGSLFEVIKAVESFDASIVGISCLVDRTNSRIKLDYPFKPLVTINALTFLPEECPLCNDGIIALKPGSTNK